MTDKPLILPLPLLLTPRLIQLAWRKHKADQIQEIMVMASKHLKLEPPGEFRTWRADLEFRSGEVVQIHVFAIQDKVGDFLGCCTGEDLPPSKEWDWDLMDRLSQILARRPGLLSSPWTQKAEDELFKEAKGGAP